jgi:hypothetical protein
VKNDNIQLVLLCPIYDIQINESFILSKSYMKEKYQLKKKEKNSIIPWVKEAGAAAG